MADQLPKAILMEFQRKNQVKQKARVLCEHEVVKIEKSGNGVKVTTKNGKEFTANSAVCTFSIGMLLHKGSRILGQFFPNEKEGF